ncbi:MAG TPA: DnaJ domain-containing protein [Verrucomicrobiae bacterium]
MQSTIPNHYATLGLDRRCSDSQIRTAYRILARQHHPDVNAGSTAAVKHTQELNAAYEVLSDPTRREAYDAEIQTAEKRPTKTRMARPQANLSQDVYLRLEDFLRGTTLEVRVKDPGQANQMEIYPLIIPPQTAPGTRFKIPRDTSGGGFVLARVKAQPDFRFKVRGSDLRCDLKITNQRALQGGTESVRGLVGNYLRVAIPRQVERGEIICLPNEGLPKTRGGRGDLQIRIMYRPEVRIIRPGKR